jgi:hypothetical protein
MDAEKSIAVLKISAVKPYITEELKEREVILRCNINALRKRRN